ncbi:hypothetical protein F01_400068 [Burkholderia cenocepacia]|nr:hypothetical protein F01_400068 [Burkholderia cenocepacia]
MRPVAWIPFSRVDKDLSVAPMQPHSYNPIHSPTITLHQDDITKCRQAPTGFSD